ncbi:hypothetical protein GQF42_37445 [Streptomyces broussonetiae]|uniref:YCII-related domain-containing protein n=1 Tax=Streptomyces broussonetiae TaxID=2686304 RepID=A0A6I6NCS7_9ACTN|nr:YciI family protein [Streptomyces broussonetiae]QHA08201.1 hypothetical protein GQF42_37445 [Streptomyces broussonetiae]
MFVLDVTYTAPPAAVDALLPDHVAWLQEQFDKGVFLAAGPKNPRDGGVILAVGEDRARIEEIIAGDPFAVAGVGTYRVTEFVATRTAPELVRHRHTPS